MEKKYELTDETIDVNGHTLHRIKALKEFYLDGDIIEIGELGGFVESESNLDQCGRCWICSNAKVYENAYVHGDSIITGNAQVYGNAKVYNSALITDNAKIYGNVEIFGSPVIYESAEIFDKASVVRNGRVYGNAKIHGNSTLIDDFCVYGDAEVYGRATITGGAEICGDAKVESNHDYIVFKNNFSSGRKFTWTKYNGMWKVGCFYGTGQELIEKALSDSKAKGESYAAYVDLVDKLCEINEF